MASDTFPEALDSRFASLETAWLLTHRSQNTRAAYETDLSRFAAWCSDSGSSPLHSDEDDVRRFCADAEENGERAAVIRRRLAALSSFFGHAVAAGAMVRNPAAAVERPQSDAVAPPAELDDREAQALLDRANELGSKTAVLVALLLLDGLKLGEALAIDIEDLDIDPSTVTVMRQGRRQALALHASTACAVDAYVTGRATGPLLVGHDATGSRLTRSGAHHMLKRASTNAGITKTVSANTLRRYYASHAYLDGASVDDVRASLGHGDRRTTRRLLPDQP